MSFFLRQRFGMIAVRPASGNADRLHEIARQAKFVCEFCGEDGKRLFVRDDSGGKHRMSKSKAQLSPFVSFYLSETPTERYVEIVKGKRKGEYTLAKIDRHVHKARLGFYMFPSGIVHHACLECSLL